METKRSVAEEAAARTREAMERAQHGPISPSERELEIEDRPPQMALPEHQPGSLIKDHPLEAALGAVSLGFLLTRFVPIWAVMGGILRGILRLGWMLFKPLALLYAGAKAVQFYRTLPTHKEEKRLED